MASDRKYFEFKGKRIVEKLSIDDTLRIGTNFLDEACYIFLLEGKLLVHSANQTVDLNLRDGLVLNCGTYFSDFVKTNLAEKSEVLIIHLYPDVLREIFRNDLPTFIKSPSSVLSLPVKTVSDDMMDHFIESMIFYFDNPQIVNEDILALKVRELILLLVQSSYAKDVISLFTALFTPQTVSVSSVVNAHLFNNLSLEELSKLSGTSLTSFKIEFKKLFGEAPARYIRKRKIERAKELLRISKYSISEIAFQTGFNDPSHFSKAFQSLCGCSPLTFREHNKTNEVN